MTSRLSLPNRRNHITQKVKIASQRTLYLSVHDDAQPAEIFLRVKGPDCSSELIGLYDVIARLMSADADQPKTATIHRRISGGLQCDTSRDSGGL